MSKQKINEIRDQLNEMIGSNQFKEALVQLDEINKDLQSKSLGIQILNLRGRYDSLQNLIISATAEQDSIIQEENKIRVAIAELKERAFDIMENGEAEEIPTPIDPTPTPPPSPATHKISIIDYAIVGLICVVFLVLLAAFAFGLFTDPVKIGLISFASAIMIVIILYLQKYKRDMGTGVFQSIKQN